MRSSLTLALITSFRCIFSPRFSGVLVENNIVLFLSKCKMGARLLSCMWKVTPLIPLTSIGTRHMCVSMHLQCIFWMILHLFNRSLIFSIFISITFPASRVGLPSFAVKAVKTGEGLLFFQHNPQR